MMHRSYPKICLKENLKEHATYTMTTCLPITPCYQYHFALLYHALPAQPFNSKIPASSKVGLFSKFRHLQSIIGFIHHLSTPLRGGFFSLLSCCAARLRENIQYCMCRTPILKNDSTAEKRRKEEAFALASIAHYCFVETKTNCV